MPTIKHNYRHTAVLSYVVVVCINWCVGGLSLHYSVRDSDQPETLLTLYTCTCYVTVCKYTYNVLC